MAHWDTPEHMDYLAQCRYSEVDALDACGVPCEVMTCNRLEPAPGHFLALCAGTGGGRPICHTPLPEEILNPLTPKGRPMAKLIVDAEGRRFTIRYSRRETIIKLLEQNADMVEEIRPPDPGKECESGPTSSLLDGGNADNGGGVTESSLPESSAPSPVPASSAKPIKKNAKKNAKKK